MDWGQVLWILIGVPLLLLLVLSPVVAERLFLALHELPDEKQDRIMNITFGLVFLSIVLLFCC